MMGTSSYTWNRLPVTGRSVIRLHLHCIGLLYISFRYRISHICCVLLSWVAHTQKKRENIILCTLHIHNIINTFTVYDFQWKYNVRTDNCAYLRFMSPCRARASMLERLPPGQQPQISTVTASNGPSWSNYSKVTT